jgi:hypothetical protein
MSITSGTPLGTITVSQKKCYDNVQDSLLDVVTLSSSQNKADNTFKNRRYSAAPVNYYNTKGNIFSNFATLSRLHYSIEILPTL